MIATMDATEELLKLNTNAQNLRDLCEVIVRVLQALHNNPDFKLPSTSRSSLSLWTPSFCKRVAPEENSRPYTVNGVAAFLGRLQSDGRADEAVRTCFTFLAAAEQELITPEFLLQVSGLSDKHIRWAAQELRKQGRGL